MNKESAFAEEEMKEEAAKGGVDNAWVEREVALLNEEYEHLLVEAVDRRSQEVVKNLANIKSIMEQLVAELLKKDMPHDEKMIAIKDTIEAYSNGKARLLAQLK